MKTVSWHKQVNYKHFINTHSLCVVGHRLQDREPGMGVLVQARIPLSVS